MDAEVMVRILLKIQSTVSSSQLRVLVTVVLDLFMTSDFLFWTQTYGMEVGSFLCRNFNFSPLFTR